MMFYVFMYVAMNLLALHYTTADAQTFSRLEFVDRDRIIVPCSSLRSLTLQLWAFDQGVWNPPLQKIKEKVRKNANFRPNRALILLESAL